MGRGEKERKLEGEFVDQGGAHVLVEPNVTNEALQVNPRNVQLRDLAHFQLELHSCLIVETLEDISIYVIIFFSYFTTRESVCSDTGSYV